MAFETNNERVNLTWTGQSLIIQGQTAELKIDRICGRYIVDVDIENRSSSDTSILYIRYVKGRKNKLNRCLVQQFKGTPKNCHCLLNSIKSFLNEISKPKNILVLLNPNSGKREAVKKYTNEAKPLFEKYHIRTEDNITKKKNEVAEILQKYDDLTQFDGIVAVGGDGFYSECITAVIKRYETDKGIDFNDPSRKLACCKIPVGILPCGSGDYVAKYLHGTRDFVTAVWKIILGNVVPTNVASLHEGGNLISYSGLILGFNLFGDMMHDCEKYRSLGPLRYSVVPFGTMLKRHPVDVKIEYLSAQEKEDTQKTKHNFSRQMSCPAVSKTTAKPNAYKRVLSIPDSFENDEWQRESGNVYAIDTHPICLKDSSGKMEPVFGDDSLRMIVTDKCKFSEHMKQLCMVKNRDPRCYDFRFIRTFKARGYRITLPSWYKISNEQHRDDKPYYVNCDGEAIKLKEQQFEVRLHSKVISIFGNVIG